MVGFRSIQGKQPCVTRLFYGYLPVVQSGKLIKNTIFFRSQSEQQITRSDSRDSRKGASIQSSKRIEMPISPCTAIRVSAQVGARKTGL